MIQDLLSLAVQRRAEIDKEINRLRLEADELDAFIEMHNKMKARFLAALPEAAPRPSIPYQAPDSDENTSATKLPPTPKAEIAKAAARLIRERQRPIPLGDLCDALTADGIVIGGNDPKANLSAKLGQSDDLISLRGHGWWIKGEPYDDYAPGASVADPVRNEHGSKSDDEALKDLLS